MALRSPSLEPADPVITPGAHYIRITTRCNHRCTFCNVDKDVAIPRDAVAAAIRAIPHDAAEVVLTGGEPTLHAGLLAMVRQIRARTEARVTVQTNGIRFVYADYVEKLRDAGVDKVVVSYPAHDPVVFRDLTRGGELGHVRTGLDHLAASSLAVVLNVVVHARSHHDLLAFARWLVERHGRRFGVLFTTLIPAVEALLAPELFVAYADAVPNLARATDLLLAAGVRFTIAGMYGMPPCVLGDVARFSETVVYLSPNCQAEVGEEQFVKAEGCASCRHSLPCLGVWKYYAERFGMGEFTPVPFVKTPLPRVEPRFDATEVGALRATIERFERGEPLDGNMLVWSVTRRCNARCEMCVGSIGADELTDLFDAAEIDALCADLAALGFRRVLFCGGEPTLVKGMPGLIRAAHDHGLETHVNTNGLLLAGVLDAYLAAGLDGVVLSLDSPRAETHDAIRGVPGSHRRVLAAATAIAARAPARARLHTVVMARNYAELAELADVAADHGIRAVDLTLVNDALGIDRAALRPDAAQLRALYREVFPALLARARQRGVRVHLAPLPLALLDAGEDAEAWVALLADPAHADAIDDELRAYAEGRYGAPYVKRRLCTSSYRDLTIDECGFVYPCGKSGAMTPEHRLGDLREASLRAIWSGERARAFRLGAPCHAACAGCFPHGREGEADDAMIERPSMWLTRLRRSAADAQPSRSTPSASITQASPATSAGDAARSPRR